MITLQVSTGAALQIFTTILVAVLTIMVSAITWYLRKYVISEVEKNSRLRRFLVGDGQLSEEGEIDDIQSRLDEIRQEQNEAHREVRHWLSGLTEFVKRIAEAVDESDVDGEIEEPEEFRAYRYRDRGEND